MGRAGDAEVQDRGNRRIYRWPNCTFPQLYERNRDLMAEFS